MNRRQNLALLFSILGLISGTAGAANQQDRSNTKWLIAQADSNNGKSKAADAAKAAHGGKVLKVEEVEKNGHKVYRVKLLLDGGRIKIVTVDGDSGKII